MNATQFWTERFSEAPHDDSEKLACAMMSDYAEYCKIGTYEQERIAQLEIMLAAARRAFVPLSLDQIKASLKPLEWEEHLYNLRVLLVGLIIEIASHDGFYRLSLYSVMNERQWSNLGDFASIDLAKEAAQNHYAAKVAELFNLTTE
jgi:hypothetical protein